MDPLLGFLLENLKQLVLYNYHLVSDAKTELDKLGDELKKFNALLKEWSKTYKKDDIFKAWERGVREMVYDIEDTIDTCVTHIAAEKANKMKQFTNLFKSIPINLAKEVKKIREEKVIPRLKDTPETLHFTVDDANDTTVADARKIRLKKTKNIVGFKKEAEEFIDFLNEKSEKLEVASIVGMAGLGKTTLTWKIFEDPIIQFEFPVRIWVNVSDSLNMENVLHTILKHFTNKAKIPEAETSQPKSTEAETRPRESYEDVLKMVKGHLKKGKLLIVFDDIWTTNAWQDIKDVLPLENPECKILVTTRHRDIAEAVSSTTRDPHYLRFLSTDESWELLQYVVYENLTDIPGELKDVGRVIAGVCDGLPLSIVVIGGILLEKKLTAGRNILAIKKAWVAISKSVKPNLVDGDKKKLLSSIISLSIEKIPYELRNCFLYLGVFPEDANIHVKELIRLWIAEGFIQEREGMSMEEVALDNLNDFINRNLVMVKKAKLDGEPKICQIHDSVREICRAEAKYDNLNLFQEITKGIFEPRENVEKIRRLCIHSYVVDFFKNNSKVPNARSFLCFHPSPIILLTDNMGLVINGFGLLRVYNAKNIKFPKFPPKLAQLLHLRYLTLVMEQCTILPDIISKLLHLQTLIVDISSKTLEVNADIWRMRQLRHLKTKATITLKSDGKGEGGTNLQTLSRLSPENCTNEVFRKARNLITLGIQGELNKLNKPTFTDGLSNLERLLKLKLVNQVLNGATAENPLGHLPGSQNFPPNLKVLVVSGTYLQWSKMIILSQLGSLEVLKLKENAFKGDTWDAVHVFPRLEILHIERSTELVYWKADTCPFPKLKFLSLKNCENLIEVPDRVCENLETLSMDRVKKAVDSAESIAERKKENGVVFTLDIAPADRSIQKP